MGNDYTANVLLFLLPLFGKKIIISTFQLFGGAFSSAGLHL